MIIPWFPWLEMVCICAGVSGFAILGGVWLGPLGIPLGALFGWFIGRYGTNVPLMMWVSRRVDSLNARSTEELRSLFTQKGGFGPGDYQTAVSIMQQRGDDLRPVLPAILDLMSSKREWTRLNAYSAFLQGFPGLASKLVDYSSEDPAEICRAKIERVRSALLGADGGS
jgi:hypothetical protein